MHRTLRKLLRAGVRYDPDYYDMYADANEAFFAQVYVNGILKVAQEHGIQSPATLLEAGCQAGRLAIPFAKLGYEVTGIDTSGFALRRAREHAQKAGVKITFIRGDLTDVLSRRVGQLFDIVVCAEVIYLSRSFKEMLRSLANALRPGGILCVSHRPKSYYIIEALRRGNMEIASYVQQHSEGPFFDASYYNWQSHEELVSLYESVGMRLLDLFPIDRFAWLTKLNPSRLSESGRRDLLRLERETRMDGGMCARYIGVLSKRPYGVENI